METQTQSEKFRHFQTRGREVCVGKSLYRQKEAALFSKTSFHQKLATVQTTLSLLLCALLTSAARSLQKCSEECALLTGLKWAWLC